MNKIKHIRTGRHCVFNMHVHLVFVTKYRRKIFNKTAMNVLHIIFSKVCDDFNATLKELDGEQDHVHLLIEYPPKLAISALVNSLKGVSSRLLRQHLPSVTKHYYKNVLWSPSYFASSCGGASIEIIKQYIQQQNHPKT